jgi:internalin A
LSATVTCRSESSLSTLVLIANSITDISALNGLTSLTNLRLDRNSITDISALSGLTSLVILSLQNNPGLTNIQPLLDNTGLGAGDTVYLQSTNVSCTDVAALEAKGVRVESDCP